MADDDFGADADFLAALEASHVAAPPHRIAPNAQRIVQPIPQRLDKAPPKQISSGIKVVQPLPQVLPNAIAGASASSKGTGSSILVSPRQKGNPILTSLRSIPWEYSDILADYVLGATTCALFLSLKYHRLHPDYIYTRIRALRSQYNLRIVLAMVDITNHEESLRELSKTSLINNVTIILCWSAAEAARYLELYKSYEFANHSAIREQRGTSYAERMVDFVTTPRAINKTDAVALVSAFGSLRGALNARPEEIAVVGGWGEKKVRAWDSVCNEPFRMRQAKRRRVEDMHDGRVVPLREESSLGLFVREELRATAGQESQPTDVNTIKATDQFHLMGDSSDEDDLAAMAEIAAAEDARIEKERRQAINKKDNELSAGVAAALARLRQA